MIGPRPGDMLGDAVLVGDYDPGSEQWAKLRARRLGGSEIAAVFGYSPYESPFSLWHRKRGTITSELDNDLTWWGQQLEDDVAARFQYLHPNCRLVQVGTYVNRDRDYQLISTDRIIIWDDGTWEPLEIKTAVRDDDWGNEGTDEVPLNYRMQCLWGLDCYGKPRHHLAVYFGAGDYREYVVEYDEHDVAMMRKRAVEFIGTVERNELPSIDGHTATYQAIRSFHPGIDPDFDVELDDELGAAYVQALRNEKAAKEAKQRQTSLVAAALGGGRRAWWRDPSGKTDDDGRPVLRAVAHREAKSDQSIPYVKANPLPKQKQEIN